MAPFAPFLLGALAVALLPPRYRAAVLIAVPLLGAASLATLEHGVRWEIALFDLALSPVRVDGLSLLFGYLFHIAALLGALFSLHLRDRVQHVAGLVYVGAALGAVFAGDLLSLFVFWELMALASVFLIWARRTERAMRAGLRYLVIQMGSGVLLLAGALMHVRDGATIEFEFLGADTPAHWLILAAFGIKCAFPLAHNWLTDAYPEATPTGAVYLSAFTTKVAVYALARGYPGTEILVYIGALMTCFPIFYAVIENDLRRVLAYSMVNQLGFMVCGIGIGTELALSGAVAHAFNDVIFKGLLMMSMGAVLHMTGRINGSDLGGLYKSMPMTTVLCIAGAASISAFPLFSGFVSKSLVMAAALEEGRGWIWLALLFASAGVFHHAGIKIPFFAFFARDAGIRTTEPPANMLAAMAIAAALCVAIGCWPWALYALVPFEVQYAPYTADHVITQLQLLAFSALAFTWLKLSGLYPPELRGTNLDAEWAYRRLGPRVALGIGARIAGFEQRARQASTRLARALLDRVARLHGSQGGLARSWSTREMVFVVVLILAGYLLMAV